MHARERGEFKEKNKKKKKTKRNEGCEKIQKGEKYECRNDKDVEKVLRSELRERYTYIQTHTCTLHVYTDTHCTHTIFF